MHACNTFFRDIYHKKMLHLKGKELFQSLKQSSKLPSEPLGINSFVDIKHKVKGKKIDKVLIG